MNCFHIPIGTCRNDSDIVFVAYFHNMNLV